MNIKSEKGISTIDITVAIIIITLLLSIVIALSIGINSNNNKIQIKSDATYYALDEIEKIKAEGWIEIPNDATLNDSGEYEPPNNGEKEYSGYIKDKDGKETAFYKKVIVKDANKINENIPEKSLQKVTVIVSYKVGNEEEQVSLSTVLEYTQSENSTDG